MASKTFELCFSVLTIGLLLFNNVSAKDNIQVYDLVRGNFSIKITNYGATVIFVILPDRDGKLDDVVLGYATIDEYKNGSSYYGALIGRVANRISGATFKLNNIVYNLSPNDHGNTLHGGVVGFHKVIWTVISYEKDSHITLNYLSQDGDQGFPGALDVNVTYKFVESDKFSIEMEATPLNKATPVNLATHSYWNLGGHGSGDAISQDIQIFASQITPVGINLIPGGEIVPVAGTPYDFQESRPIKSKFTDLVKGYDINYVINHQPNECLDKVAVLEDRKSGRRMELSSNQPGVQFYTANMRRTVTGKNGAIYQGYAAVCLETQGLPDSVSLPDSVNHPNFPSQFVNPGQKYEHVMVYRFTTF